MSALRRKHLSYLAVLVFVNKNNTKNPMKWVATAFTAFDPKALAHWWWWCRALLL